MKSILACTLAFIVTLPAQAMDLQSFRTPSDNIHCMFITDDSVTAVECELRSRSNTKPALPKPGNCDLEWGNRFALDAKGKAGMVCYGDTLVDQSAPIVGYGEAASTNGITCLSEETGMTCKNRMGRGFSLSRALQRVF